MTPALPRPRPALRTLLMVLLVAALSTVPACNGARAATPAPAGAAAPAGPPYGVIDSTCTPERLAQERAVGVTFNEVEVYWDRMMPRPGVVNTDYLVSARAQIQRCRDAGMHVVVGSGTQYPPAWVRALPGAALLDQRGKPTTDPAIDTVFSGPVRAAEADYLAHLAHDLPPVDAVRLGVSAAGEWGYPGPNAAGDGFLQSWWAFGPAPQRGVGLAAGQQASPMPGWVPGQRTWNNRPVTPAMARSWFLWYQGAQTQAIGAQAAALRQAGFGQEIRIPSPGRGVLPRDLTLATNALLDGTGDRDGSLGRGLDYVDQFPALARAVPGPVVVALTSVDDGTTPLARSVSPRQDMCTNADPATSLDPMADVATWPNLRFARAQAVRAGMNAVGENAGPPGDLTGGVSWSDDEKTQIHWGPIYARSCNLALFSTSFEPDLFTGRSGASLADLAAAIGSPAPAPAPTAAPAPGRTAAPVAAPAPVRAASPVPAPVRAAPAPRPVAVRAR